MYGTQRALSAYKMVGIETGVESADPHKLILMLFDGALITVGDARRHLAECRTAERGNGRQRLIHSRRIFTCTGMPVCRLRTTECRDQHNGLQSPRNSGFQVTLPASEIRRAAV